MESIFNKIGAAIKCCRSASISINGRTYSGNSVSVINDRVVVDGVEQDGEMLTHPISVQIIGNCESIETTTGDVTIAGSVSGNVEAMSGDVQCSEIGGDVETMSGSVTCGDVSGRVSTMSGDILVGAK